MKRLPGAAAAAGQRQRAAGRRWGWKAAPYTAQRKPVNGTEHSLAEAGSPEIEDKWVVMAV